MTYKASTFNYWVADKNELLIVNFKKGMSSFRIVTGEEINIVKKYLFCDSCEIDIPNDTEKALIDGGFLILKNHCEDDEVELMQMDYIYNNTLQLVVHVTSDCNFRCKYCFIDFKHQKMLPLVQSQIVNYVRLNINKYSGLYISWFGGEPLMGMDVISNISEKVIDICKRAKKTYIAAITTNGYLLTPERIKKLISLKVYSYCITLDGLERSHDKQRVLVNGGPTFQTIVSNLKYIKENIQFRYLNVCVRTNFTKTTLENITDFFDFFKNEFGDDKRFRPLFKLASDWGGERIEEVRHELLGPDAIRVVYETTLNQAPLFSINHLMSLNLGGLTCNAIQKNKYTISTDGLISKCDTSCEETKIGHIDSQGWHIDPVKEAQWLLAYRVKGEECSNCPFRTMCFNGSCPKKKVLKDKNSTCPKPIFAKQLLLLWKQTIDIESKGEFV